MVVQVSLEEAYQTALTALGAAIVREQLLTAELARHQQHAEQQLPADQPATPTPEVTA